jgi:hypothetical protein
LKLAAFALTLCFAGIAVAQQAGIPVVVPPVKDTVEPIRQISTITNRIPAVRYPFAQGRIEKIDLSKQHLTLTAPGGPYRFKYESRTYIFLDAQKVTADALKPGDFLKVSFVTNSVGEATIRRIKAERPELPAAQ